MRMTGAWPFGLPPAAQPFEEPLAPELEPQLHSEHAPFNVPVNENSIFLDLNPGMTAGPVLPQPAARVHPRYGDSDNDEEELSQQYVQYDMTVPLSGPSLRVANPIVSENLLGPTRIERPANLVPRESGHRPQGAGLYAPLVPAAPQHQLSQRSREPCAQISPPSMQSAAASTDSLPSLMDEGEHNRAPSEAASTLTSSSEVGSKKGRPRPSRSIKQVAGDTRKRLVDTAYRYMRARIAGVNAYPEKKEMTEMICDAWLDSWTELQDDGVVLVGLNQEMAKEEVALIRSRITQVRGELKDAACDKLDRFYTFDRVPPQPTDPLAIKNKNFYARLIAPERKPLFLRAGAPPNANAALYRARDRLALKDARESLRSPSLAQNVEREPYLPRSRGAEASVGLASPSLGEYAGSSESTIILWRGGGQTYIGHIYPDSDKIGA
ncbi:hypothetical protein PHLGIDRAFT_516880 [Phlebiopsis gigantea 11061_1 CR5-6]|uniref:DUF6532 domain-containing protein n=1 Tax=Phlebiopsis gigantea (strain 11061_1 CR5-6) TaxID=745531 RepID=A0A0C3PIW2_PHLG1|nr:hypothetical protein PHLGIDRAFT_516880 [Phlebiopsis gigantea 11061_1 CR5-6]